MTNPKTGFNAVYLLAGLAFVAYLIAKIWLIPVTHDESVTAMNFQRFNFAQIIFYDYRGISANNHILNSIVSKACSNMVGLSPMSLRCGNLLTAILYLVFGYLVLGAFFKSNLLRFAGMFLWLGDPYLAEFFALSRGYGMATGLEAGAILMAGLYLAPGRNPVQRHWSLAGAMALSALAVWANFVALNFYLSLTPLLLWDIWLKREKPWVRTGIVAVVSALLGWLIATPLRKINTAGDFGYYGTSGYFKDTLGTFADCTTLGKNYFGPYNMEILQAIMVLVFTGSVGVGAWKLWKNKGRLDVQTLFLAVLPVTVLANLLITKVTGASYLSTRTTLFLYPLLVYAVLALLQVLYNQSKLLTWLVVLPVVYGLGFNFIKNATIKETYEWRYDRNTYSVLNYIEQMYHCEGRTEPYDLRVHCLFHPSFQFHTWVSRTRYEKYIERVQEIPCSVPEPVDSTADFFYVQRKYLDHFPPNYKLVLETDDNESVVLRRY